MTQKKNTKTYLHHLRFLRFLYWPQQTFVKYCHSFHCIYNQRQPNTRSPSMTKQSPNFLYISLPTSSSSSFASIHGPYPCTHITGYTAHCACNDEKLSLSFQLNFSLKHYSTYRWAFLKNLCSTMCYSYWCSSGILLLVAFNALITGRLYGLFVENGQLKVEWVHSEWDCSNDGLIYDDWWRRGYPKILKHTGKFFVEFILCYSTLSQT